MKLKYLLPFIVSMIFFSFARIHPKSQELVVLKQQLPYEITNVSVSSSTLTIEGWAFINGNQHFLNQNTHSISIEFTSSNDQFNVLSTLNPMDMSALMHYRGARTCQENEYYKASSTCNYTYKNVGFNLVVPLEMFEKEQKYTAMLVVHAKQTNTKYKIQLFYPIKQPIIKQIGDYQFKLSSSMQDTRLVVNHENVVVRSGPSSAYPIIHYGSYCSSAYTNKLFYKNNQVFSSIIDKVSVNGISVYRLKGDILGCSNLKQRVKEGNIIDPIYIASTFVEYSGTMLSIENRLINEPPVLSLNHPIVQLDEAFDYRDFVSAYDPEEKDISNQIRVLQNSYKNEVGQYQITFYVEDKHGYSDTKTMNVTVKGPLNAPPLLFVHDRIIKQYSFFDPLEGVQAYDKEDGTLTNYIELENNVVTDEIGTFIQCYRVTDSMNAATTQCATINIIKRNEIINHRFVNLAIKNIEHISWHTHQRELERELYNREPILASIYN